MTAHRTVLVVVVLALVAVCRGNFHPLLWLDKGNLTSAEGYGLYYVGENVTLLCHKYSNTSGDMYFKYGNKDISSEFVEQVGARDARMSRPVTREDVEKAKYQCLDNDWIASLYIYSDYAPQNATDLQVVWLNKTDVHISWKFGDIHYKNVDQDINRISVNWRTDLDSDQTWRACTHQSNQTCNITGFTELNATLFVRVNITNLLRGDSAERVFPGVFLVDHAKPLAVKSVRVKSLSSRSVEVSVTADQRELNYITEYYPAGRDRGRAGRKVKVTGMTEEKTWRIQHLHPDYTYRFDVNARFEQGYTSDLPAENTTIRMPEDAPDSAPIIPPAGYYLDDKRCSQSRNRSAATAYIFFQDIPEKDQNGVITSYTAEASDLSISQTVGAEEGRSLKLNNMPCDRDVVVVRVFGSTGVGPSPSGSLSLYLGHQDLRRTTEKLKLRMRILNQEGAMRAEWTPPPPSSASLSLFLYYCQQSSKDDRQCQDAIQYVQVNASDGQLDLKKMKAFMKFGVAVVTAEGLTSGIHFTDCYYDPAADAGQSPGNLRAYGKEDHLEVHWNGQGTCNPENRVIVLNYIIQVCQDNTTCDTYRVDADSISYSVTGLETDRVYHVAIRANTTSEPTSLTPFSDPMPVLLSSGPKGVPLSSGAITGITISVLITVLGFILLCGCMFSDKIRKTKDKFRSSIFPKSYRVRDVRQNRSDQFGSGPVRKIDAGTTNLAYCNGSSDGRDIHTWVNEIEEAQTTEEGMRPGSVAISLDDLGNTAAALNRSEDGIVVGHVTVAVNPVPSTASPATDTGLTDTPAKRNTKDIASQEMSVNHALSKGDGGSGGKVVGCWKDDDGEGHIPDPLPVPVLNSSYVKCTMAGAHRLPSQVVGDSQDTSSGCVQVPEENSNVRLSDSISNVDSLEGDSGHGMDGNDLSGSESSSSTDEDDSHFLGQPDSLYVADMESAKETVEGQSAGGHHAAQRGLTMAIVNWSNSQDQWQEEREDGEENQAMDPDSSRCLPHHNVIWPPQPVCSLEQPPTLRTPQPDREQEEMNDVRLSGHLSNIFRDLQLSSAAEEEETDDAHLTEADRCNSNGSDCQPESVAGFLSPSMGNLPSEAAETDTVQILDKAWKGDVVHYDTRSAYKKGVPEAKDGASSSGGYTSHTVLSADSSQSLPLADSFRNSTEESSGQSPTQGPEPNKADGCVAHSPTCPPASQSGSVDPSSPDGTFPQTSEPSDQCRSTCYFPHSPPSADLDEESVSGDSSVSQTSMLADETASSDHETGDRGELTHIGILALPTLDSTSGGTSSRGITASSSADDCVTEQKTDDLDAGQEGGDAQKHERVRQDSGYSSPPCLDSFSPNWQHR